MYSLSKKIIDWMECWTPEN